MIYNETLSSSYGKFSEITEKVSPIPYKPLPKQEDYKKGYITRYFSKKINEDLIFEVKSETVGTLNSNLYKVVYLDWKISGPRNNTYKTGIMDKAGVIEQNKFEIDRIHKEENIDLSSALPNLLEYWQGK